MSSSKAAAGKLLETAGSRQKRIESFKLFLLILPCLALVFVFHYMPLWGWVYAFFQYKPGMSLANCKFVGFQNFTNLFGNPIMRENLFRVLRNTLGIAPAQVLEQVAVPKVIERAARAVFQSAAVASYRVTKSVSGSLGSEGSTFVSAYSLADWI